jgi:hypothetical protein
MLRLVVESLALLLLAQRHWRTEHFTQHHRLTQASSIPQHAGQIPITSESRRAGSTSQHTCWQLEGIRHVSPCCSALRVERADLLLEFSLALQHGRIVLRPVRLSPPQRRRNRQRPLDRRRWCKHQRRRLVRGAPRCLCLSLGNSTPNLLLNSPGPLVGIHRRLLRQVVRRGVATRRLSTLGQPPRESRSDDDDQLQVIENPVHPGGVSSDKDQVSIS